MSKVLAALFLILGGCSSGTSNDQLQISSRFKTVILVDASGRSCTSQVKTPNDPEDLTGLKALIGAVKLDWVGARELEILYIRFRFLIPNAQGQAQDEQEMILSGEELGFLLGTAGKRVVMAANSKLDSATLGCNLELGGLKVPDKRVNAFGQGIVSVYGVALSESDQPQAVQAQTSFSFQYDGQR